VSWHRSVIAALRRLRQEDDEFKDSLNYIARLSLKKKKCLFLNPLKKMDIQVDASHQGLIPVGPWAGVSPSAGVLPSIELIKQNVCCALFRLWILR
jgi:hypothetical protein